METQLTKAIDMAEKACLDMLKKSHVKAYTRADGSQVKEHDDSRHPQIIGQATKMDHKDPSQAYTFEHGGKSYVGTGKEGKSMHDGTPVREFESDKGDRKWLDNKGNVHADSKEEADQHHKRGMYADHEAEKQQASPQADSNRDKWDKLGDDENPNGAMRQIGSSELGKIATGKTDVTQRAKEELAARGVDEHGKWMGFDKAAKHHGTEGAKQKHDEIDGHFQTLHHKVLGAIASGHTDPKRLASEELANRGHDHDGKWIGFDKANKLHGVK